MIQRKFLREVPLDRLTDDILEYEKRGGILIFKEDSVEVWLEEEQ